MPVEIDVFRRVIGSFPSGVTIITAVDGDGTPRGLTSNAVTSVSASPPLLLVCVDKLSNTLPAMEHGGAFVVNFLAEGADGVALRFASKSSDKLTGLRWVPSLWARGAPVLIEHIVAHAECLVVDRVAAGDHWIFIGRIEHGEVYEGVPLMYFRRRFAPWPHADGDGQAIAAGVRGAQDLEALFAQSIDLI